MAIQLRDGESVRYTAHFHWITYLIPAIWAVFLSVIAMGQIVALIAGSNIQASSFGLFWTLLIGGGPLAWRWLQNKCKAYIITDQRLYVEEGVIAKSKKDIPLTKVNDIEMKQSIVQRLFGPGDIVVLTGNDKITRLKDIDLPESFKNQLTMAMGQYSGNQIKTSS